MKATSLELAAHLSGEVTTLATYGKITHRDNVVLGFTDHHIRDLEIDGVTYRAAGGYTRTAVRSTADLAVDNLDVESVVSDDGTTEADLRARLYDFAGIRMFLVNYQDLSQGILKLRRGWLGEVSIRDGMHVAKLRGMAQKLQMGVGEVYTPDCSADLGDSRCGVDLGLLEESGSVTSVAGDMTFETGLAQATGWYDGGEWTWTAGANVSQTVAVRRRDAEAGTLNLFLPALYTVEVGDAFTIRPGCNKNFATCKAKFGNTVNTTRDQTGWEGVEGETGVGAEGVGVCIGCGQADEAGSGQPVAHGLALRTGRLQPVAERLQLIDLRHDAVLRGEGGSTTCIASHAG